MTTSRTPQQEPLVPQRLALIVLFALVVGGGIGTLTFFAFGSVAQAVLAGVVIVGTAIVSLDKIIGK